MLDEVDSALVESVLEQLKVGEGLVGGGLADERYNGFRRELGSVGRDVEQHHARRHCKSLAVCQPALSSNKTMILFWSGMMTWANSRWARLISSVETLGRIRK